MKLKLSLICLGVLFFLSSAAGITPGFIFNADNIFLDLEESHGGVGFKVRDVDLGFMDINIRAGLGMDFIDGTDVYNISGNITVEIPFFEEARISPYTGFFMRGAFRKLYIQIPDDTPDPDSWSSTIYRPLHFGAIAGIECFLLDFVSVFVEYEAVLEINTSRLDSNLIQPQDEVNMKFKMQMGNEGMIGICFYFRPVVKDKA